MNKFLDAPKVKRTHCYVQNPKEYEIECPICGGHNIEWSEFEGHIWCYKCKKDIYIDLYHSGIFSGPIPMGTATYIFGLCFDRFNIETKEIVKFDDIEKFNSTWVKTDELIKYEKENYFNKENS